MPETETESKRDRIAKEIQKRIQKGFSKEQAYNQVKESDEFNHSYVQEVFDKFFQQDIEPRTDLQQEIVDVYDEDPSRTYVEIAKIVADNLERRSVDPSLVSDYTSRFRNDFRTKVDLPAGLPKTGRNLGDNVSFTEDGIEISDGTDEEQQELGETKTESPIEEEVVEVTTESAAQDQDSNLEEYVLSDDERYEVLEALFKTDASEETIRKFLD